MQTLVDSIDFPAVFLHQRLRLGRTLRPLLQQLPKRIFIVARQFLP
jgi:hypothetical protein